MADCGSEPFTASEKKSVTTRRRYRHASEPNQRAKLNSNHT